MNKIFNNKFLIRPITPEDKAPLQLGLAQLSSESRRQRFFSSRKDFTDKELKFFTEVDQHDHIAFVAIDTSGNQPAPAGSIRSVRDNKRPDFAEMAITVIDKYHKQGLGLALFETLAEEARLQKITHFYGDFHTSNTGMMKLLEKYCRIHNIPNEHIQLTRTSDGFLYFELPLV